MRKSTLVIPPTGSRTIGVSPANSPFSESAGAQAGVIVSDSETGTSLKTRALEDLQRAWKSIRSLEDLSDDKSESQAAKRAVAFVDKAFAALEGGG